jgi:hypothetical protein
MEIESRLDALIEALDENLQYEPPTGLQLLVELIARKVDEADLGSMMRGEE